MIITFNSTNADAIFGETATSAHHAGSLAAVPHALPGARAFPILGRRPRRNRTSGGGAESFAASPRRDDERAHVARRRGR